MLSFLPQKTSADGATRQWPGSRKVTLFCTGGWSDGAWARDLEGGEMAITMAVIVGDVETILFGVSLDPRAHANRSLIPPAQGKFYV